MVSTKDIAEKAGVSRGTVDRALHNRGRVSEKTRQHVLKIAEELGYQPNIVAKGLAARKRKIKLGFIYIASSFSPVQSMIAEGAKHYAKEKLEPYGVEVEFIRLEGSRPSQDMAEISLWKEIKDYDFDGIALIGPLAADLQKALEEHGRKQIPFVLYNVIGDCSWKRSYVGCDFKKAGRIACGLAALMTQEKGKVAILSIDYKDIPSSVLRLEGFKEEIQNYPDMDIVSVIEAEEVLTNPDSSILNHIDKMLTENSVDVIYLVYAGGDVQSESIARIAKNHNVRVVTSDLVTDKQKELLKQGYFAAEVLQNPESQGKKALEILFELTALDKEPVDEWYESSMDIVISQNM